MKREIDTHELEVAQQNGNAVLKFKEDPTIQQVFKDMDRKYFELWKASQNVEEREHLFHKASALSDLDNVLQAVIDAGTIATRELAQRSK